MDFYKKYLIVFMIFILVTIFDVEGSSGARRLKRKAPDETSDHEHNRGHKRSRSSEPVIMRSSFEESTEKYKSDSSNSNQSMQDADDETGYLQDTSSSNDSSDDSINKDLKEKKRRVKKALKTVPSSVNRRKSMHGQSSTRKHTITTGRMMERMKSFDISHQNKTKEPKSKKGYKSN